MYFVCTMSMPGAYDSQKQASNPLELQLKMAKICHVGVGNNLCPLNLSKCP